MIIVTLSDDLNRILDSFISQIAEQHDTFVSNGSGYSTIDILTSTLNIFKADPMYAAGITSRERERERLERHGIETWMNRANP